MTDENVMRKISSQCPEFLWRQSKRRDMKKVFFYFLYDFCVGIQHDSLMVSYTNLQKLDHAFQRKK